jgi:amidase
MKVFWIIAVFASAVVGTSANGAPGDSDIAGRWEVTTTYPGGSYVSGLDLSLQQGSLTGRSGWLVPDWAIFYYQGTRQGHALHLKIAYKDGSPIGDLTLTHDRDVLKGTGSIHGVAVTLVGRRPQTRSGNAPTLHTFEPQLYYRNFSGANPPALHIFPGDSVRTKTLDARGVDDKGVTRSLPQNPLTGPFYVEGAMPGDTIAVRFNKIRLSRNTAFQYRAGLDSGVLPPGYRQDRPDNWSDTWNLDRTAGTATPDRPSDNLKAFRVKLRPMLGCVGVAPYWNRSEDTADLGPYGGNIDYNQIVEGSTFYLPVYQAGALLSIGDGHALQEDGEITGQGFETSMDVEFTVQLIRDQLLDQPWSENDEYIMVSGIAGSLGDALQTATAGLSNWLKSYYRLNSAEIATVLASSIQYDIATVVDPKIHVVAKIKKDILSQIPKAETPTDMFCQASWGCELNYSVPHTGPSP